MEDAPRKNKPRIPKTTALLMVSVAVFYDTLQVLFFLIPYLGPVLSYFVLLCSFITFNILWFHVCNVRFTEQMFGRIGRWGVLKLLIRVGVPAALEIFTGGLAPSITLWVFFTITGVRESDLLVEKGIVTREQLDQIDDFVLKMGKKHGFESKEFRKEMGLALGHEIGKKAAKHIPERLVSAKTEARYGKINDKHLKYIPQKSVHELDLKK